MAGQNPREMLVALRDQIDTLIRAMDGDGAAEIAVGKKIARCSMCDERSNVLTEYGSRRFCPTCVHLA